jgi:hypothetical protein
LIDNGKPLVPVTALAQLSALQARRWSTAVENAPLAITKGRRKESRYITGRLKTDGKAQTIFGRVTGLEKVPGVNRQCPILKTEQRVWLLIYS